MGGRDAVLGKAREAIEQEDYRWAADIATWAVRADNDDMEARRVKAQALRGWAYRQKTSTWRNWGLCQALELEGKLGAQRAGHRIQPGQVRNYPTGGLLELMTVRLKAEEAFGTHLTLGFVSTDTEESCGLEIRRGVCQFHETLPDSCDATLTFKRQFLSDWAEGVADIEEGIDSGRVELTGDRSVIAEFFGKFEPAEGSGPFAMSVR